MIRINLSYIFQLSSQLEPLKELPQGDGVKYHSVVVALMLADNSITNLLSSSVFAHNLRSSFQLADDLLGVIRSETQKEENFDRDVSQFDLYRIKTLYEQYRAALLAELGVFPAYLVYQKGGFDTLALLDNGSLLFPHELAKKVPEAIFDVTEAGKALAFELPTACGFHIFRATESVLRRYYAEVTSGKAQPKVRNISVYVNALRQAKIGDSKIISVLDQLSKLHRNPVIHPDVILTIDEAISIVGISRSAVTAMLAALPIVPPTTALPQ